MSFFAIQERYIQMRREKRRILSPEGLIYLVLGCGIFAQMMSLVFSQGRFLETIVYDFSRFTDFFDHVRRFYLGLDLVYQEGMHACFPPLAYCIYFLISRILYNDNIGAPQDLAVSGSGMLVICMLTALFALFFAFAFDRLFGARQSAGKKLLAFLLFCSYPFWLAVERGNMSQLVLILLMYACAGMDSEKKAEKEAALILIAFAAGLKLYPAIFGVLYLAEKRYKEAVRLIIYGILLFFLPFIFFQGVDGFWIFLRNISAVGSGTTGVTIAGLCGRVGEAIGLDLALGHQIGRILSILYLGIVVFFCFLNKKSWQTIALLTSLMIIFVAASGTYCLVYWVIPFLCFMNDLYQRREYRKLDYVYAVLFALVFAAYPVRALGSSGMLYAALYLLIVLILADQTVLSVKRMKVMKRKKGV